MQSTREAAQPAPRNQIRLLLIAVVSGLSLFLAASLIWRGADAWMDYRQQAKTQEFDAAANKLIVGLFEVLMERLFVNNALQAAEPATPGVLAEIEAHRKLVRENFEPGLAALTGC